MKTFDKVLAAAIIIVFVLAGLAVTQAVKASDENGERFCMAQNIYFESGNQPFSGKLAVANVTLNRVSDHQFPDTICHVVYQSKEYKESWLTGEMIPVRGQCQFSWFCDGRSDEPRDSVTWLESIRIADLVLGSEQYLDITDGALWYHADYIYPYWADHLERLVVIENHIFYK
jgi:spore germination cell wall hydrolase CwlJ-like protein